MRSGIVRGVRAAIGLGSNLGDRLATLRAATHALGHLGDVVAVSSLFETEPRDVPDQPAFLNAVVVIETALAPRALLDGCQAIEHDHGRIRAIPGGPRTLDLDVLLCDDLVVDEPRLQIPHPRLAQRRFVLVPLCELLPAARHPPTGTTIAELLERCADGGAVHATMLPLRPEPSPRLVSPGEGP